MAEVPRKATPVAQADVVRQLPPAFELAGVPLNRAAARLFLALVFLENKRGTAIFNHNWGNLAAGQSWQGDVWRPEWYRQSDIDALPPGDRKARLQVLHDRMGTDVPSAFRSYPTSSDGLRAFANLFKAKRYEPLVAVALTGDPGGFAAALRSSGYTPDLNVAEHAASYKALLREFERAGYFGELPESGSAPAAVGVIAESAYVPLGFESTADGAIHLAKPRCAFKVRELQALNALGNGVILDIRLRRKGKLETCLASDDAVPARIFGEPRRLELPVMLEGDELAIYVSGSVSAFVAWGQVG